MGNKHSQSLNQIKLNDNFLTAVSNNNLVKMRTYLSQGAKITATDENNNTAFILATSANEFATLAVLMEYLVGNPKVGDVPVLDIKNEYGDTALIIAAFNGYTNIVGALLSAGCNKAIQDNGGDTAHSWAQRKGNGEILLLFSQFSTIQPPPEEQRDVEMKCVAVQTEHALSANPKTCILSSPVIQKPQKMPVDSSKKKTFLEKTLII